MSIAAVSPRGLNQGAINKITTDTPSQLTMGAAKVIPAMQALQIEMESDSDQLFGDEEVKDTYSKTVAIKGTCTHGQIDLDTLAEITGGAYSASGTTPNQVSRVTLGPPESLPYFRLRALVLYVGDLFGGEMVQEITKCKLTSLTIKKASKTYAVVEFGFSGQAPKYPAAYSLGGLELRETAAGLVDAVDYTDRRLVLPVWQPDSSNGTWTPTTGSNYLRNRVQVAISLTDSLTWSRVLGIGTHTLNVYCYKFVTAGILTVYVDGVAVGTLDLYAASPSNTSVSLAFLITTAGNHEIKCEITGKNASSSGYAAYLSDVIVTGPDYSRTNTLPRLEQITHSIRPAEYTDNDGTVTVATPGGAYPEQLEQTALGDWMEWTVWLDPGTYSLKAFLGKTSDGGSTTFYADGVAVGSAFDGYNSSTVAPATQTIGSFSVTRRKLVTIKALTTGKNASSTGYRRSVSWIQLVQTAAGNSLLDGVLSATTIHLSPWNSDGNTNFATTAYNASQLLTYWIRSSSGAQNAEIYWDGITLEAGTYEVVLVGVKGGSSGKVHVLFDSDDLGEIDLYAASTTYNQILSVEITVDETKSARLSLKMVDKNASSSSYTGQISYVTLKKVS